MAAGCNASPENFSLTLNLWAFDTSRRLAVLKGHDFSRAEITAKSTRAVELAEKLKTEGGGGFSPRITPTKTSVASAAEVGFS
jgi:hypothetical protein